MKHKIYNKLVRDKIPQIIEAEGNKAVCKTLDEAGYIQHLNEKLLEEVQEYLKSGELEELADIGEVMHAILAYKGIPLEEFQKARMTKLEQRGGFKERILLEEVIEE